MSQRKDYELPDVLAGCRKQLRESQHALYKMFYGYGMSVAIRYVKNEEEAISVVNDSFMKVFKGIKSFDLKKSFKPWFRRIVVNTAINHIQKQSKFEVESKIEEAGEVAAREEILSQINYEDLIRMVQSLGFKYRTVFNLYVIDGFKHEEIAKTLGITVSTSKSNLSRARHRMRELLKEQINS